MIWSSLRSCWLRRVGKVRLWNLTLENENYNPHQLFQNILSPPPPLILSCCQGGEGNVSAAVTSTVTKHSKITFSACLKLAHMKARARARPSVQNWTKNAVWREILSTHVREFCRSFSMLLFATWVKARNQGLNINANTSVISKNIFITNDSSSRKRKRSV